MNNHKMKQRISALIWSTVFYCSIIYQLGLIIILYGTLDYSRALMSYLDPTLGREIPQDIPDDYNGNCLLYDPSSTEHPFKNLWDNFDIYCIAHLLGWWAKTLMLRDYWTLTLLSLLFEVLEYTLEHQLPIFFECWWDHWIIDFLLCNGGGILIGGLTIQLLNLPTYSWLNLSSASDGKLWHWFGFLGIVALASITDLTVFYIKSALWIPTTNFILVLRQVLVWLCGTRAAMECQSGRKGLGRQSWMLIIMVTTEAMISVKFKHEVIFLLPSQNIIIFWTSIFCCIALFSSWICFGMGSPRKSQRSSKEE